MGVDRRLRIAITPLATFDGEAEWITAILEAGWDYVHLRHPAASLRDVKAIIEDIPPRLHARLRLHGHFELLNEFNLGGIHLNSRCPDAPKLYNGSISRTCHSLSEVNRHTANCDYVTLSPIFPSVSKPGYGPQFAPGELESITAANVIALGGVTPARAAELKGLPFAGYAVLGYLFEADSIDGLRERLNSFEN